MSIQVIRPKQKAAIKEFLTKPAPKSGFTYLRGRRRIGKSTLLEEVAQANSRQVFYFTGANDETAKNTLKRFAASWDRFWPASNLNKIKPSELTWEYLFETINKNITEKKSKGPIGLIFDEIQWLARPGNGFIGLLKAAWLYFERNQKTRIIVCGSSNKFFSQHVGGEEKILRGLKTHANIWIPPLTIAEIKNHYGKTYTTEEICFGYMLIGGIPYYWNQLDTNLTFLQSLNRAMFLKSTIFLEEVDEILKLEFNNKGLPTIKKIMAHTAYPGLSAAKIIERSQLPESTVLEALEKLTEYGILNGDSPALRVSSKANRSGILYYCKDPYLNFYFCTYQKWEHKIRKNDKDFLISKLLDSRVGLYINGFTGHAFELVLRYHLENYENPLKSLLKSLGVENLSFKTGRHWDKETEIDLILYDVEDRKIRLIECKWCTKEQIAKEGVKKLETLKDKYPNSQLYLVTNQEITAKPSKNKISTKTQNETKTLNLEDLIES